MLSVIDWTWNGVNGSYFSLLRFFQTNSMVMIVLSTLALVIALVIFLKDQYND